MFFYWKHFILLKEARIIQLYLNAISNLSYHIESFHIVSMLHVQVKNIEAYSDAHQSL